MKVSTLIAGALVATVIGPATVFAQSIYVNAVEVRGTQLSGRSFTDVEEVFFDDEGNTHIVAPGIAFQTGNGTVTRDQDANALLLGTRFWVLTTQTGNGTLDFEIRVRLNGEVIATVESNGRQAVTDITEYIALGSNNVSFDVVPGGRGSGNVSDNFTVMLIRGDRNGSQMQIGHRYATLSIDGNETPTTTAYDFEVERVTEE